LNPEDESGDYIDYVCLMSKRTGKVYFEKLNFIQNELARFKKTLRELTMEAKTVWIFYCYVSVYALPLTVSNVVVMNPRNRNDAFPFPSLCSL
jgi:hypothetical protein